MWYYSCFDHQSSSSPKKTALPSHLERTSANPKGLREKEMEGLGSMSCIFVPVYLSFLASFIVGPAITDVTMFALCPGQDECSIAIYLTGVHQVVIGLGSVVMMPLIGNLSDKYGRKTLLTVPLSISIIPPAILAYKRTKNYVYAYYVVKSFSGMISDGGINCLALAYLADNIPEAKRTLAFGILTGTTLAALVSSTLAARFISKASAFQVATASSALALVYMRIFLKERAQNVKNDLKEPILISGHENADNNGEPRKETTFFEKFPAVQDIISLLKSSKTFSQAALIAFFTSLSDSGLQATLNYYLKSRFHFGKDQYANAMLILSVAQMTTQLILMPLLLPIISEEKLLSIGIFADFTFIFLDGIAWSSWVPYVATGAASFTIFTVSSLRSIVSKQVGLHEQGKVQGCISGVSSFATIIAPLIFSPLSALFLSERAPFDFPGFSILCIGIAPVSAFILSLFIRPNLPNPSHRFKTNTHTVA